MEETKKATFIEFLLEWNRMQKLETPRLHVHMAEWLEARWMTGQKRILLMAFRSAGKSTIVGLFAAWLIYCSPDIRILVLAADFALAKKMVRNVKRIIESHPLTNQMKPKKADQWAGDFFTVVRETELRDPTMLARGVTSNITGSRADVVICDDVEVPNTCDTEGKRVALRDRLREMSYILVAGGRQIYVGTPHHYYSIYADVPREEIGEEEPFLIDFTRFSMPILDAEGKSAWPEKYDADTIDLMRRETGPNKFESQMMLRPMNILNARLDPDLLQPYKDDLVYSKYEDENYLGNIKITRKSCFWDPSTASEKGDDSVVAIVFSDDHGNYYIHHVEYIKINPLDTATNQTQQCRIVANLVREYGIKLVMVESNGLGKFLPDALRTEIGAIDLDVRVNKMDSSANKDTRIIEGFDALLAAERLWVHDSVRKSRFIMEMREWRPKGKGRDDALDAVAGALAQLPNTAKRHFRSRTALVVAKTVLDD